MVADGATRPPKTGARVEPGEIRSTSSPSRAPSVATDTSRRVTPVKVRKRRQRVYTPATPGGKAESAADTVSNAPATPTPTKTSSARAQRMASTVKLVPSTSDTGSHMTESEAGSMAIMAEYMSNNNEDLWYLSGLRCWTNTQT
ncbi:hypothetical protein N7532_003272 [Penicillium argentinense]|uniref:Uncharacterized protein n=1 Tax=Penicillium argentinense TaxID=1131581 RepID=A0A9W9FM64_9EURO|nr:uncharacterized protein N7532_003272 [Penicillium argentinense]KAJ5102743.1 hypothetical protein N7532_003272 [Penicillium argentinense]